MEIETVRIETLSPDWNSPKWRLEKGTYNLLSVSKESEAGNTTKFFFVEVGVNRGLRRKGHSIHNESWKLVLLRILSQGESKLYTKSDKKEQLWYHRYGHVGEQTLQKLPKYGMVEKFDYNSMKRVGFWESCVGGKINHNPFKPSGRCSSEPLEQIHSDVWRKMGEKAREGAEYFLTFVDNHSRYAWFYPPKTKDQDLSVSSSGKHPLRTRSEKR